MKIGDRVTYDDEDREPHYHLVGTIVEPTEEERASIKTVEYPELIGPSQGDVMVEWNDGARYWEHPSYLVVVGGAEQ